VNIPENLKYTESHEWVRVEGDKAVIGITDYAQDALGDIVYVELPEPGTKIAKGDEVVNIESVKVAEAVNAPVTGTIAEVNEALSDQPEAINKDAYGAFIYAVTLADASEVEGLMDASAYKAFLDTQE
jgi:glycine cleavage system H protein